MTTKQFQIFKEFTERMKSEMEANAHKGEWVHWRNQMEMLSELQHHENKLTLAISVSNKSQIREYAADVANIAMFIYNSTSPIDEDNKMVETNFRLPIPNCEHCEDGTDPEKPWLDCPMCCGSGIIES